MSYSITSVSAAGSINNYREIGIETPLTKGLTTKEISLLLTNTLKAYRQMGFLTFHTDGKMLVVEGKEVIRVFKITKYENTIITPIPNISIQSDSDVQQRS